MFGLGNIAMRPEGFQVWYTKFYHFFLPNWRKNAITTHSVPPALQFKSWWLWYPLWLKTSHPVLPYCHDMIGWFEISLCYSSLAFREKGCLSNKSFFTSIIHKALIVLIWRPPSMHAYYGNTSCGVSGLGIQNPSLFTN